MKKHFLLTVAGGLLISAAVQAQTIWGFDEDSNEIFVPIQCDGQFDEEQGGVFIPTTQELYEQGDLFLAGDKAQQAQAGYCFMSAAIQGDVNAQFKLAQMYDKGVGLPQDDINAYKWAYMAALAGNQEAARLSLVLEQFLSAEDIQTATVEAQALLPRLKNETTAAINKETATLEQKKAQLENINKEIDAMLGVSFTPPEIKYITKQEPATAESPILLKKTQAVEEVDAAPVAKATPLFDESDRL